MCGVSSRVSAGSRNTLGGMFLLLIHMRHCSCLSDYSRSCFPHTLFPELFQCSYGLTFRSSLRNVCFCLAPISDSSVSERVLRLSPFSFACVLWFALIFCSVVFVLFCSSFSRFLRVVLFFCSWVVSHDTHQSDKMLVAAVLFSVCLLWAMGTVCCNVKKPVTRNVISAPQETEEEEMTRLADEEAAREQEKQEQEVRERIMKQRLEEAERRAAEAREEAARQEAAEAAAVEAAREAAAAERRAREARHWS